MKRWLFCCLALMLVALTGCEDVHSDRDVQTDVTCSSAQSCDLHGLTCTLTFDETYTTFIDEYGHDFDRHETLSDRTETVRHDEIDETALILASFQEEVLTSVTIDEYISIDPYGHESISSTETTIVTITTWEQDCPTCPIRLCTTYDRGPRTCQVTPHWPEFPVCAG